VFYTQPDDEPTSPADFAARWLQGLQRRVPDYPVNRDPSPAKNLTTSAYWTHKTFGIPGITYEIGDNTDRAQLKRVASAAAQEMMSLMLGMKDEPQAAPASLGR
jgi:cytosolic carboxypeptidase protein 6